MIGERRRGNRAHNAPLIAGIQEAAVKGDTKVIEFLNKQLKHELTAVNRHRRLALENTAPPFWRAAPV